jgi:hypothetical protein
MLKWDSMPPRLLLMKNRFPPIDACLTFSYKLNKNIIVLLDLSEVCNLSSAHSATRTILHCIGSS